MQAGGCARLADESVSSHCARGTDRLALALSSCPSHAPHTNKNSWERTGSHRSRRDDKGGMTTTTEHVAVPVQNVRVVDQV
jgi:hypothetical protein